MEQDGFIGHSKNHHEKRFHHEIIPDSPPTGFRGAIGRLNVQRVKLANI